MRRPLLIAVPVLAVAAGAAFLLLRAPAPEAVDLTAPAATAPAPGVAAGGGSAAEEDTAPATDAPGTDDVPVEDPTGTWTVRTGLVAFDGEAGAGTWVGYRVDEELATAGAFTAVGRTPEVTGTVVVEGDTVASARIEADLSALRSDSGARDGQVRRILGDRPAVFELSAPLTFGDVPEPGASVVLEAPGRLGIGEVSGDVVMALAASLDGDVLVLRGTTEILLEEFDVAVPSAAIVLSVADTATVELQLLLTRD